MQKIGAILILIVALFFTIDAWSFQVKLASAYTNARRGNWPKVISTLHATEMLEPRGHLLLMAAYDGMGWPASTHREAMKLLAKRPYSYHAYRSIIDAYHQLGHDKLALRWTRRGLRAIPNDPVLTRALKILTRKEQQWLTF